MASGKTTSAESLYFYLKDNQKGAALFCLQQWGLSGDSLRTCIRHFWKHDNSLVFKMEGFSLLSLRELFRQAQFPIPPTLGFPLKVYRGTWGKQFEEAREGLCWTTDRNAACWFATHRDKGKANDPLVLFAHVQADQVLFCDNERDGTFEQEVVLDQVDHAEIDPVKSSWVECGKRFIENRKSALPA